MGYFHNRLTKTYICDTIYATAKFFTKRYIFYVSDFCAWCAENIPSKRCMCFLFLRDEFSATALLSEEQE